MPSCCRSSAGRTTCPLLDTAVVIHGKIPSYPTPSSIGENQNYENRKVYGIPPEQVIGSSIKTRCEMRDGKPVLVRLPEMNFIDDKENKPVGIDAHIGRRPIAAFGNSDGDREMLEYTQGGGGARLMMLVHHDDAAREFAYGADSKIGTFSDALTAEAKTNGWTVISMKDDWKRMFPVAP